MKRQSKPAGPLGLSGFENHHEFTSAAATSDFLAAIAAARLSPPMMLRTFPQPAFSVSEPSCDAGQVVPGERYARAARHKEE